MPKRSPFLAALLVALVPSPSAMAQGVPAPPSLENYQLPPGEAPAVPPVQGPLDPAHPAAQPAVAPPPPIDPVAQADRREPTSETDATTRAGRNARPGPTELPQQDAPAPPTPETTAAGPPAAIARPAQEPAPVAAPAPLNRPVFSWWLAVGAAVILLAAVGALALLSSARRRRNRAVDAEDPDRTRSLAHPTSPAKRIPRPCFSPVELEIDLEPQRLMLTLVNARLSYRLTLANKGAQAVQMVDVSADLVGAHSALSNAEQLDFEGGEQVHGIGRIEPSETACFEGELVIPIASIPPVRAGDGAYFAALARFAITMSDGSGARLAKKALFLVGEKGKVAPRLARLDLGPRTLSSLSARGIDPQVEAQRGH